MKQDFSPLLKQRLLFGPCGRMASPNLSVEAARPSVFLLALSGSPLRGAPRYATVPAARSGITKVSHVPSSMQELEFSTRSPLLHLFATHQDNLTRILLTHASVFPRTTHDSELNIDIQDALVGKSLQQYRLAMDIFDAMLASLKAAPQAAATAATTPPSAAASSPGKENNSGGAPSSAEPSSNGKGKGKGSSGVDEAPPPPPPQASSGPSSAIEEIEDVRDAIRETIETMVSGKDMEALAEYKSGAGATTVGFGDPSPPSAFAGGATAAAPGAGGVTATGFGAPSGAATTATGFGGGSATGFAPPTVAGAGGGAAANVMVVKRKGRPAPKAAPPAGAQEAVAEGGGVKSSPKKAKSNE